MSYKNMLGTLEQSFFVGFTKSTTAVKLTAEQLAAIAIDGITFKNKAGSLVPVEASQVSVDNDDGLILGGNGSPNFLRLARDAAQAAPLTFQFPATGGTQGQYLSKGSGNSTEWLDFYFTKVEKTTFDFNTSAGAAKFIFTLAENHIVLKTSIHYTTVFDDTFDIQVGTSADPNQLLESAEQDSSTVGKYTVERDDPLTGGAGGTDIEATVTKGAPTQGAGFILIETVLPFPNPALT